MLADVAAQAAVCEAVIARGGGAELAAYPTLGCRQEKTSNGRRSRVRLSRKRDPEIGGEVDDAHRPDVVEQPERAIRTESDPETTRGVATPTGFEPAISALTGQCVKPLHHGAARCSRESASAKILARRGTTVNTSPFRTAPSLAQPVTALARAPRKPPTVMRCRSL